MPATKERIPLPAYVSGVRVKFGGEDCIQIAGVDGYTYAFVPCGRNSHLYALADAKEMVAGLNARALSPKAEAR